MLPCPQLALLPLLLLPPLLLLLLLPAGAVADEQAQLLRSSAAAFDSDVVDILAVRPSERILLLASGALLVAKDGDDLSWTPALEDVAAVKFRPLTGFVYAVRRNAELYVSQSPASSFVKVSTPATANVSDLASASASAASALPVLLRFHPVKAELILLVMQNRVYVSHPTPNQKSEAPWYAAGTARDCDFLNEAGSATRIVCLVSISAVRNIMVERSFDGSSGADNYVETNLVDSQINVHVTRFSMVAQNTLIVALASRGENTARRTYVGFAPSRNEWPQVIDETTLRQDSLCEGSEDCDYHVVASSPERLLVSFIPFTARNHGAANSARRGTLAVVAIGNDPLVFVRRALRDVVLETLEDGSEEAQVRYVPSGIVFANKYNATTDGKDPQPITLFSLNNAASAWYRPRIIGADGKPNATLYIANLRDMRFAHLLPGFALAVAQEQDDANEGALAQPALYVSENYGQTWRRVMNGRYHNAFIDFSGRYVAVPMGSHTLTLAKDIMATSTISATLNATQGTVKMLSAAVDRMLAIVSRTATGSVVELFSNSQDKSNCPTSDLELHTPFKDCLLGLNITYMFKKRDATCVMDKPVQINSSVCACETRDFECANLNEMSSMKQECPAFGNTPPHNCKAGDKYMQKPAYWRVPTSACSGGLELDAPVEHTCGSKPQLLAGISTHPLSSSIHTVHFAGQKRTILQLVDGSLHSSMDYGYSWQALQLNSTICASNEKTNEFYALLNYWLAYWSPSLKTSYEVYLPLPAEVYDKLWDNSLLLPHPDVAGNIFVTFESRANPEKSFSYYSLNSGISWTEVKVDKLKRCQWVNSTGGNEAGKDNTLMCMRDSTLIMSSDYFVTQQRSFENVVSATPYSNGVLVVIKNDAAKNHGSQLLMLLRGEKIAEAQLFDENGHIAYADDIRVHASESGAIFLFNVENNKKEGTKHPTATLYKLIAEPNIFKLMTRGIYFSTKNDEIHFTEVKSSIGRFIANFVVEPEAHRSPLTDGADAVTVISKISIDNGITWKTLNPPKTYNNGTETPCLSDGSAICGTHLQFLRDINGKLRSFDGPAGSGMLIASGNAGTHLAPPEETYLYISNDFGATWTEATLGAESYGSVSYDTLIVAVNSAGNVTLSYSVDGTAGVDSDLILNVALDNIRFLDRQKSAAAARDGIVLFEGKNSESEVTLYTLSLNLDAFYKCDANGNTAEMETKSACLFGRTVDIVRRKNGAQCLVGDAPQKSVKDGCQCQAADYDCNVGYNRTESGECVMQDAPAPICDGMQQRRLSGYLKSRISTCVGGIQREEYEVYTCEPKRSFWGKLFKWVLGISLVCGAYYGANVLVLRNTGMPIHVHAQDMYYSAVRPYAQVPSAPRASPQLGSTLELPPGETSVVI